MEIERAKELIRKADGILVCAGAGMGVDSGLPDFRGKEGFWKAYPPYAKKGLGFMDMAAPSWFKTDPEFAWGFYGHRLNLYQNTEPHKGFNHILNWGIKARKGVFAYTSNVDGQFQKSGLANQRVYECHGTIHYLQCLNKCGEETFLSKNFEVKVNEETMRAEGPLPRCPRCKGLARPNILMFGDDDWDDDIQENQAVFFYNWLEDVQPERLVILEIGAGTTIATVRYQAQAVVNDHGGTIIRINPDESEISPPHISLRGGALETLEALNYLADDCF